MKKINILAVAVAIIILATSCGQNAQKQKQDAEQAANETHYAYIKFDGETLLVDEFDWVSNQDDELIKKYGLDKEDIYDDGVNINEEVKYEEWKLLPDATFNVVEYFATEEGSPYRLDRVDISRDEFIARYADCGENECDMLITGSRSGVSRIERIFRGD